MNTNRQSAVGILYLVFGVSSLGNLINMLSIFGALPDLDYVGNLLISAAASFFFLTAGARSFFESEWLDWIVDRSQYSWYATAAGYLLRSIAMFVGGLFSLPEPLWGVWFIFISGLCAYIGYIGAFVIKLSD